MGYINNSKNLGILNVTVIQERVRSRSIWESCPGMPLGVSLKTTLYRYQVSLWTRTLCQLHSQSLFAILRLVSLHLCKQINLLRRKISGLPRRRARPVTKQHIFLSTRSVLARRQYSQYNYIDTL